MLIDEVIAELQKIRATHGNLEVMTTDDEGNKYGSNSCYVEVAADNQYPKDWKMPKGFTFVCIS